MNNIPEVKVGIVAVSRDCFPESLSVNRREDSFLYISKFQEEVFVGRDGKRPGREQICFIQTLFQNIP